jgi:ABC-type sugar transport system, periplasmic component
MKKLISLLLIILTACSLFAAGGKEATAATASTSDNVELTGTLCSATPKEFTLFLNFNNMPFNKDWPVWQKAAEMTNVSFVGTIPQSNSNEEEAYNLMLSSGKLADVIGYKDMAVMEQLGRDGGLIPLNDLIEQYAPHIKAAMERDVAFRNACYALDGKIYTIPKNQSLFAAEYWWIREDWLNKLGLKMPETVDELHDVLLAFRNNDPNGNGLKDEVPLFDRAGWKMPDEYLYLWDTSTEFYARDGKIVFEPLEDNFKVGVKNLVQWYKEGILDPEIFTRGPKGRDILLSGDLGGCTHDWVSAGNYNETLSKSIPGFKMVPFAPPADQNGNRVERVSRFPGPGWGISSQCSDPVTVMRFFDFCFTPEGNELMNWGIEGVTFERDANGKKYFNDTVMKSDMSPLGYLRSLGVQYRIGMEQDGDYEYAFMSEIGKVASEMYNSHKEWFRLEEPPFSDGKLNLKYPADVESEYQKIMSNIRPYVDEKFQSWLLGTADFEADYDKFVQELKKRGIDRAIEINQLAFDIYMGKN